MSEEKFNQNSLNSRSIRFYNGQIVDARKECATITKVAELFDVAMSIV